MAFVFVLHSPHVTIVLLQVSSLLISARDRSPDMKRASSFSGAAMTRFVLLGGGKAYAEMRSDSIGDGSKANEKGDK